MASVALKYPIITRVGSANQMNRRRCNFSEIRLSAKSIQGIVLNSHMASGLTGNGGYRRQLQFSINDKNEGDFAIIDHSGDTAPGIAGQNV